MIKNNKLWRSVGLFVLTIAFSASVHSASMDPVDIELGDIAAGEFLCRSIMMLVCGSGRN